ncbi:cytochrome b/b6 domain-containing protein [Roseovarius sp. D22-M7]|uniref:cytochrome b/b6 domain-containing protein n=1 Tax=Roseovarius sp. D22-M7 TaxID=3127116 RepID=UPI0030103ED4
MPLTNSTTTYGSVTKTFHWLIALLIVSNVALGWIASDLAHRVESSANEALIDRASLLFSIHKTTGVAIFFAALARILWAVSQPKPGLLNGDRPLEARAAQTAHWLLYGSLVAVPLSGWVHHAATSGFAPIWWPFGQTLPLVPKSESVSETAATLHFLLQWVMVGAIGAHVAGALKHHVIDRDATLRRMLPGRTPAQPTARQPGHALPLVAALAIWGGTIGGAGAIGMFDAPEQATPSLAEVESEWKVDSGNLSITVVQMGSEVTGSFDEWTADIAYSETPDANGQHGTVEVEVAIRSLSLGSVTSQAMGADFFNVEEHPTAKFTADLVADEDGKIATGTLTIRDQSVPVEMPFEVTIDGDTATASGGLTVDRRNFNIGQGVKDEGSLAYSVDIAFELTATRAGSAD